MDRLSGTGLELRRTDVAANGQLAALELEQWNGGTQEIGKIGVIATQGVDQDPPLRWIVSCRPPESPRTSRCHQTRRASPGPTTGASRWPGCRPTAGEPCALGSPPVVISPTASQGAIGGANVAPFLPASGQPPGGGPPSGGGAGGGALVATLPKKVTTNALAGAKGVPVKVRVARAGKVKIPGPCRRRSSSQQIGRRRQGIDDRKARRDRNGEVAADRRRAQEAEPLKGRADDAARDPGSPQHHEARHAPIARPEALRVCERAGRRAVLRIPLRSGSSRFALCPAAGLQSPL